MENKANPSHFILAMRPILLLSLVALLLQVNALGTSYVMPTWEESATTSEFIGVVECVTAGGIVARYRVIDSWKGAPAGSEFNISQHVDSCGPLFPVSLVGERSLVFADKALPYHASPWSLFNRHPLWWRIIAPDYVCFSVIPIDEPPESHLPNYLGYRNGGLTQFKSEVIDFLKCDEEGQELRLMLSEARKHLHLPDPSNPSDMGNEADIKLYALLSGEQNVDRLWERILQHAASLNPPPIPKTAEELNVHRHKSMLLGMIGYGGRARCKALLDGADLSKLPWERKELEIAVSRLRGKLSPQRRLPMPQGGNTLNQKPITPGDISKAEALLTKAWNDQSGEAFELLCRHSPGSSVPLLLEWQSSREQQTQQYGYLLGSVFGHLCASDRIKHLNSLLSADDPWIRASAAVYLCFDDDKQGEDALRKLLAFEGDPGAWAALVLVSRGDKTAMTRALEVMVTPHDQGMATMNHHNLQLRLQVLLSNVANVSGVVQPPTAPKEYLDSSQRAALHRQWHESLSKWWEENEGRIKLSDPWAKTLAEQKVD